MASSADQMIMGLLKTAGLGSTPNSVAADNVAIQGGQLQNQQARMQLSQAAQQAQRQQEYQQDTQAYFADPQPARLAQLIAKYPDQAKPIQEAHAALDAPAQQARVGIMSSIYHAAQRNRPDLISHQLSQVIAAEKAAGHDTTEAESVLADLDTGKPEAVTGALAFSQAQLALIDPEWAKQNLPKPGENHFSSTSDGLVYDQRTGATARDAPAKPVKVAQVPIYDDQGHRVGTQLIDESGNPVSGGGGQASSAVGGGRPSAPGSRATSQQLFEVARNFIPGTRLNSGQRSAEHNAEVGGVPGSQHISGTAIDIPIPKGITPQELKAEYARKGIAVDVLPEPDKNHWHIQAARNAGGGAQSGGYFGPRPSAPSESLSQAAISSMAQQYLAGDKTVMVGLGRGQQGAADIRRLRGEIAKQAADAGMSGRDIAARMADFAGVVSGERAAGTRIAQIELAATEAEKIIPLALKASDAFPRSNFVPFARAQQMIANGTNDPKLRQFVTANQALVNVYSRAVSPTGAPTVSDKEHARELLSTAYDQASYRAVVYQMRREIAAARAAPRDVRGALFGSVGTMGGTRPKAAPSRGWGHAQVVH